MASYLFVLGRSPELAFLELSHNIASISRVGVQVALGQIQESPETLIALLGGTVKIALYLGTFDRLEPERLASLLTVNQNQRIVFGISTFGTAERSIAMVSAVKKILESNGASVRYVEAKHGSELSSVVVAKQQVQELVVVFHDGKYLVGRTVAVQPFEAWNSRDYERPFADARAGMLPPKVARMIVNIALKNSEVFQGKPFTKAPMKKTLLDPFCGMGTILAEALMTGWDVVGSDQKEDVVDKANKNLGWLMGKYPQIGGTYRVVVSEATHVSQVLQGTTVDAVVTEPFMGSTAIASAGAKVANKTIKNTIKGLEKLYIGCLKDWVRVLKSGGTVVMAIPSYTVGGRIFFVKKVIDSCERLGYTICAGPIEYGRPQAVVRRQFYIFRKK